jgi:hypothetical protein
VLQYRTWLTNTSAAAIPGIILIDPIDPRLELLEVRATHGSAEFRDQSLLVDVGALEVGESALVVFDAAVNTSAQPGDIILSQAIAHFDGGPAGSNVVAAGLPPNELPATGKDGRKP